VTALPRWAAAEETTAALHWEFGTGGKAVVARDSPAALSQTWCQYQRDIEGARVFEGLGNAHQTTKPNRLPAEYWQGQVRGKRSLDPSSGIPLFNGRAAQS
jgi:hypothetical protein